MWKMKTKGLQEERGLRVDVISTHIHITNITANFWGLFLQINHGLYASKLGSNVSNNNKKSECRCCVPAVD